MQKIELNGKEYQLPESWKELSQYKSSQTLFPKLIDLLFMRAATGDVYHQILQLLLGIKPKAWKKLMRFYFADTVSNKAKERSAEAIQQLLRVIDWLWKEPVLVRPLEFFELKGIKYFLPEENFYTMSWGELKNAYIHCEAFGRQLVEGDTHLDLLVATLCRPERAGDYKTDQWNGDIREPFNEFVAKERARQIKNLPFATKFSILLYFVGTTKDLLNSYDIYPSDGDTGDTEAYLGQGFEENTLVMAEKGIFGNYEQTSVTNCHNILIALERNKRLLEAEIEASRHDSY